MKKYGLFIVFIVLTTLSIAQETKTIHVYVALCDNEFQGIVQVPDRIGNGKDPVHNLYWGCGYGVKSFFKLKTTDWVYLKSMESSNPKILEQVLFKHATKDIYLLAEAYDGEQIKSCTEDFLKASNGQNPMNVDVDSKTLSFGGGAYLIAYIGHDGLMDFDVNVKYQTPPSKPIDIIVLACYSQDYFSPHIKQAGANPILWTTHLMAPEAYTLKSALDGWMLNETGLQIEERAAQTYNQYQKCGLRGARNLFTTGFK